MMSVFLGPIEHSTWTHFVWWTELRQIFPAEWTLHSNLLNQKAASAATRLLVFTTTFCSLCRGPIRSFFLPATFKSHSKWNHGNTLFPYPLYPCYYYVSRFFKLRWVAQSSLLSLVSSLSPPSFPWLTHTQLWHSCTHTSALPLCRW